MVRKRAVLALAVTAFAGCQLPSGNLTPRLETSTPPKLAQQVESERISDSPLATQRSTFESASSSDRTVVRTVGYTSQEPMPPVKKEDVPPPLPDEVGELPQIDALAASSLDEFEQMALQTNPSLSEAAARVEALRGKWIQVGLAPNTILGYSGQQLGSGGQAEQNGVLVEQEFVRGGKLALNRCVVAQEIRRAEQQRMAQQQRVLTDVRLSYFDVLIAQRRTEVAEELVRIAQETVATAESLLKAREVSQVDVMRARIELQTSQLLLKNARIATAAAWSRLASVVGFPDIEERRLDGPLEGPFVSLDPDETLQRILAESPQLTAALAEVDRARWNVSRQRVEPIPNIDVQAIAQSDNATGSSNANLQVTFPLPCLDRNQGSIRQAYSELRAARQATDRIRLGLQRRLATVYQRYANANNQVVDYSRPEGILENSRKTLEFIRKGYQAGEIGYLDLLTAQRTYAETNLTYLEALGEFWSALIEIDGLLLKDSLEEPVAGVAEGF